MSSNELSGKVAIVTGATRKRGLGRAIALCLAQAGADVVVTGASAKGSLTGDERQEGWLGLASVVEEIRALGRRAHGVVVDVSDAVAVQRMVDEAVAELGRIDILVNNAAYPRPPAPGPGAGPRAPLWARIVEVNLNGTMYCAKYAAAQMLKQGRGGSIVSISSGAALKAPVNFAAYAASKAGVHALTSSLADELGPAGITANVVAPGFLDTARIDMLREEGRWEKRLSTIPIKRPGTPQEVAELVRYLCGPHARWISGEVFLINGGEVRRAAN